MMSSPPTLIDWYLTEFYTKNSCMRLMLAIRLNQNSKNNALKYTKTLCTVESWGIVENQLISLKVCHYKRPLSPYTHICVFVYIQILHYCSFKDLYLIFKSFKTLKSSVIALCQLEQPNV